METPRYVISTNIGCMPNIIQPSHESLKKDLLMYIDDFVFRGSIYDEINSSNDKMVSLRDLCSVSTGVKIYLTFRKDSKVLFSKRGNYKLSKDKYSVLLDVLQPDFYCCYDTGNMINKQTNEIVELSDPLSLKDFVSLFKTGKRLFGTRWINNITENGCMLNFEDNKIMIKEIFECTCCNNLTEGYLKHLFKIKEMNCFYYLTIHNYNILNTILDSLSKKEMDADELEVDDNILYKQIEEKKEYEASKKKEGKQREANRSKVVQNASANPPINL